MSSQIAAPARVATLAVWRGHELMMGLRRDNMKWTTPGGHLNSAESPIAGAIRELKEETGLDATADQMQYLGSAQVAGRSGAPVELHMFQMDVGMRPALNISNDPDHEVHGWGFVDVSNGIPSGLAANLHTPKNHLFRSLGLMQFEDGVKLSMPIALKAGEHFPPAEARRMAGLGLEGAAMFGRKLPAPALARAKALVEGRGMSKDEIRDTARYFSLYGNCLGENDSRGEPSDRHLECMLWGGPAAAKWTAALASTLSNRLAAPSRLAEGENEETSGKDKKPTREVVSRSMPEVSGDIKKAGVDDNDNDPESDREIPGGPRRKTDAEMKEDPAEKLLK